MNSNSGFCVCVFYVLIESFDRSPEVLDVAINEEIKPAPVRVTTGIVNYGLYTAEAIGFLIMGTSLSLKPGFIEPG